eukprot:1147991-Pelagomonas_calceolata.AAC.2
MSSYPRLLRQPRLNVSPCLQHSTFADADMNLDCAGLELMNRLKATYQSFLFGLVGSVIELQRLWLKTE